MALLFIFLTILLTVLGQLLVKQGMLEVGSSPNELLLLPQFVIAALFNWKVTSGLACAFGAALSWIVAISRSDLSFAYPFTAVGVVLVLLASSIIFDEVVPMTRWLGVLIVVIGIIVASR